MTTEENETCTFLSCADKSELGETEYEERLKLFESLDQEVCTEIKKTVELGLFVAKDLDQKALNALKDLPPSEAASAVREFRECKTDDITNKGSFLCGIIKDRREKKMTSIKVPFTEADYVEHPCTPQSPNDDKIKALLDRTGYSLEASSGQRKYGGPPPDWNEPPPPNGHELYCGKLPRDMYEDELVPLFEEHGRLWDMRLMMDPVQGRNRGFCFVTYCQMEAANAAVKALNNYEIRPGKLLKVNISDPNCRLFIGNIPKTKSKEDIMDELKKHLDGMVDVIVYGSPDDPKIKNRGFAFVDFDSHRSASAARRRIMIGRLVIWGLQVICDWAEPLDLDPSEEVMAKVKVLYIRNLKSDVTEQELRGMFEKFGSIDRVKKVKSYGFVHFNERESALEAMKQMHGTKVSDVEIDVSLAKPLLKNKTKENNKKVNQSYKQAGYQWYEPFWGGSHGGRSNNYNRKHNSRNYSNYYGNNFYYEYPNNDCYNNGYDYYGYADGYNFFEVKPRGVVQNNNRRGLLHYLNEYTQRPHGYGRSNSNHHKRGSYSRRGNLNNKNNKSAVSCNA